MYYSYNRGNLELNRIAIHFGDHAHFIVKDMYRDSVEKIYGLIEEHVAKTPMANNSTIVLF